MGLAELESNLQSNKWRDYLREERKGRDTKEIGGETRKRGLTLSVTTQDRYFLLSPMSMTLLRKGTASLILSSIGTGAMFSPPDVMISSIEKYHVGGSK